MKSSFEGKFTKYRKPRRKQRRKFLDDEDDYEIDIIEGGGDFKTDGK